MRIWGTSALVAGCLVLGGCAGPNLWTDQSSVSTGRSSRGRVRRPARMSSRGKGFKMSERWRKRGFRFGTDELVAALKRAAGRVHAQDWRTKAGFADLSPERGGPSAWHKSHQSGRDADVLFYTKQTNGRPMHPPEEDMIVFLGDGKPILPAEYTDGYKDPKWSERRFDPRKNWLFIEALLQDPTVRVQWIFISRGLKALTLNRARKEKRPAWLIEYADVVMRQPADSRPHDDHMHIRVYCSRGDRFHGCEDRGPIWQHEKKRYKYHGPERYDPVLWRQLAAMTGQTGG